MRLYPEKLAAQLADRLLPVYVVSGDEPLRVLEAAEVLAVEDDLTRAVAQARERLAPTAVGSPWPWSSLTSTTSKPSTTPKVIRPATKYSALSPKGCEVPFALTTRWAGSVERNSSSWNWSGL
mgnify:CR=1 FL=1